MNLSVRPLKSSEAHFVVDYFHNASDEFLLKMGADRLKLPARKIWIELIEQQSQLPYNEMSMYYVIWLLDDEPIGHSNINRITFGQEAFMHLHLWNPTRRKSGMGQQLVSQSIPYYFENFRLKRLLCEPNAFNNPPNRTLPKVGFRHIKTYETTPGPINFFQTVNRWEILPDQMTPK